MHPNLLHALLSTARISSLLSSINALSNSSKNSNTNPKVKTMEKEKIGIRSPTCNILGVGGCVGTPGWGLGQMTNGSIIHTNLHKPNNKLVNA